MKSFDSLPPVVKYYPLNHLECQELGLNLANHARLIPNKVLVHLPSYVNIILMKMASPDIHTSIFPAQL